MTLFLRQPTSDTPKINTGCTSKLGDFATLFFLVHQHWGRCRYRHFADNFKAF